MEVLLTLLVLALIYYSLKKRSKKGNQPASARARTVFRDSDFLEEWDDYETKVFRVRIAGVSYKNSEGTSRQKILKKCNIGECLIIKREPKNRYDPNAIAIFRQNGEQLGYIPREFAEWLAPKMDNGLEPLVHIKKRLVGDGPLVGCLIELDCRN